MFILTTDPTRFILSLVQQCKLPPKIAYGVLAGYRFLPLFREELRILQNAHRIRGLPRARGIRNRLQQLRRYLIPLLASAIRKAERAALAMESKGFTGSKERTYYTEIKIRLQDWLLVLILIGTLGISYWISWNLGYS